MGHSVQYSRGRPRRGYKYDTGSTTPKVQKYGTEGICVHADEAAVNVNFWITKDEANNDPAGGGLIVYDRVAVGAGLSFKDYNSRSVRYCLCPVFPLLSRPRHCLCPVFPLLSCPRHCLRPVLSLLSTTLPSPYFCAAFVSTTLPSPCFSAAFVFKTLLSQRAFAAFVSTTLPSPCFPAAFVSKTLIFLASRKR